MTEQITDSGRPVRLELVKALLEAIAECEALREEIRRLKSAWYFEGLP